MTNQVEKLTLNLPICPVRLRVENVRPEYPYVSALLEIMSSWLKPFVFHIDTGSRQWTSDSHDRQGASPFSLPFVAHRKGVRPSPALGPLAESASPPSSLRRG